MLIYLHGLNSAGSSAKAAWLREHLPDVTVLSPTYAAHNATTAPAALRAFITQARAAHPGDSRLLLVGSSLGGFWAQYLAPPLGAGMVLINPALRPDESLLRFCGPQRNEVTNERYELTPEQVRAMARYRLARCNPHVPTLVLLDAADEVIDYRIAEDFYRGCGTTFVYPGGSHRFEHLPEALPAIRRLYDTL